MDTTDTLEISLFGDYQFMLGFQTNFPSLRMIESILISKF